MTNELNNPPEEPVEGQIPEFLQRYARQIRFDPIGVTGQIQLSESLAVVVGCGALGSVIANTLVRAGVGRIRLVDRDYLELTNLQRQVLYDEADVEAGIPKAIAAARKLRVINSDVIVEPMVVDLDYRNAAEVCKQADVIVDGTDNFETRFLVNDLALETDTPWIYGGCVGSQGQSMTIVPGETRCLRCLMTEGPPPPGTTPTCDTAGILGPVVNVVASIQSNEALKILSGNVEQISRKLTVIDMWSNRLHQMDLSGLTGTSCPACGDGKRDWLNGQFSNSSSLLCGRNAVQIRSANELELDLEKIEDRLRASGRTERNDFLLRFFVDEFQLTLFPDGRAIIVGTDDEAKARSLYAQWIGN